MKKEIYLISLLVFSQGCTPVVVGLGGAAAGIYIANDRRSTGTYIDDQTIMIKSRIALAEDKELWKRSHIQILCYNNILLLSGQVPNAEGKERAEEIVRTIPKVRKIFNEITVDNPTSILTRSQDTMISTQFYVQLIANQELSQSRIKYITDDGILYLMGILSQDEQNMATQIASSIPNVKKVYKIFETYN